MVGDYLWPKEAPGGRSGQRGLEVRGQRAKSVIEVAKMEPRDQNCDSGCKNRARRAKSVIGVAKMEPREPNLR